MLGFGGNDIYRINSVLDDIREIGGQGTDTVITRNASTTLKTNFENLTLDNTTGFLTALNGTGNSNGNILSGLSGNDTISAGAGADTIIGGAGTDTMTDDGGSDTYDFNALSESVVGVNRDICTDFTHNVDTISLETIDAVPGGLDNDFTFIGNVAFAGGAATEVRFFLSGANVIVQVDDNDGDAVADMEIQLTGAGPVGINAS